MNGWNWNPKRSAGIWCHGLPALRPLVAVSPYVTVVLLAVMLWFLGDTMTLAKGVLFDLPNSQVADGEAAKMVALVMPFERDTLVFFDDARYILGDDVSAEALSEHFRERTSEVGNRSLLVLADRNVAGGELMRFASLARQGGVERVLFAEKRGTEWE